MPRNILPQGSDRERELLEPLRAKGAEKLEGEIEKTNVVRQYIDLTNAWVAQEISQLGLEPRAGLGAERVHILTESAFNALSNYDKSAGFHRTVEGDICIPEKSTLLEPLSDEEIKKKYNVEAELRYRKQMKKHKLQKQFYESKGIKRTDFVFPRRDRAEFREYYRAHADEWDARQRADIIDGERRKDLEARRTDLLKVLVHEVIHTHQASVFAEEDGKVGTVKIGYQSDAGFLALNEAVTESMATEIVEKHRPDFADTDLAYEERANLRTVAIPETREELLSDVFTKKGAYHLPQVMLGQIIEKVAAHNQEAPEVAWRRMKRGQFTGEMMHLRSVERAIGKGALRLIANLHADKDKMMATAAMTIEDGSLVTRRRLQEKVFAVPDDAPNEQKKMVDKARRRFNSRVSDDVAPSAKTDEPDAGAASSLTLAQ